MVHFKAAQPCIVRSDLLLSILNNMMYVSCINTADIHPVAAWVIPFYLCCRRGACQLY
jgi:hypothetical protein